MLNAVGKLESSPTTASIPVASVDQPETETAATSTRALVATQAKNTQQMAHVLCGAEANTFLKYDETDTTSADKQVGPLAAGLVHCVAVWPLQTPCYVSLTLAVHQQQQTQQQTLTTTAQQPVKFPFAARCLQYAVRMLARDLDQVLLESNSSAVTDEDRPRAVLRVRLILRYLALLAGQNIVQQSSDDCFVPNTSQALSLLGLLEALVQAAIQACDRHQNMPAACVLAVLVLSTVPYLQPFISTQDITEKILEPLERIVGSYVSTFAPGLGSTAILLKEEQLEDIGHEIDPEEDDDEDDDDQEDDDDAGGQVCDSLQDLLRSVKYCMKEQDEESSRPLRFALFSDAPWQGLQQTVPASSKEDSTEQEGETTPAEVAVAVATTIPIVYTGEPMTIAIYNECKSLTMLMGGGGDTESDTQLARISLDGIVFGRLPIFGPPSEMVEDDDDDEEDEDMDAGTPKNERLQAYKTEFGLVDRYFLCEAVRDCLISHESNVDDKGVEHGNVKVVAEQVWSICQMLTGENTKGIEYSILEAFLSLIVQTTSASSFRFIYLSRVLLELVRLDPATLAPAVAVAVSNLFQDYMPALVPTARYNLSRWFAFHLVNTNYQWPAGYWKHWEPFVSYGWHNSRGAFVKGALGIIMENESNPSLVISDCLPNESVLVDYLLESPPSSTSALEGSALEALEAEVINRICQMREDPEMLLKYLVGDELSESVAGALASEAHTAATRWWRSGIVIRAMLSPAVGEYKRLKDIVEQARNADVNGIQEDDESSDDILASILDILTQYRPLLLGAIARDAADADSSQGTAVSETEILELGETFLLEQVNGMTFYSPAVFDCCIQFLLRQNVIGVKVALRWSLGDRGEGESDAPVFRRWWEIATLAFRLGVSELGDIQSSPMAVDDDEASERNVLMAFLDPLLTYVVQRVCDLLLRLSESDSKGSKFAPEQVDLVEGAKCVTRRVHNLYISMSRESKVGYKTTKGLEIAAALSLSAIAGPRLSLLCSDAEGNPAVHWLRKSLDRM